MQALRNSTKSCTLWEMILKKLTPFVLVLLLCACGSSGHISSHLTPTPEIIQDPSDALIIPFVEAYVKNRNGPPNTRFDYARKDLNGDGLREAFIMFKGPYNYWCGWTGCEMIILKGRHESFELLTEVNAVRGPMIISDLRTKGWKDLVIRISGANMPDRNVVMRFDGKAYPSSPEGQTSIRASLGQIPGVRIFP